MENEQELNTGDGSTGEEVQTQQEEQDSSSASEEKMPEGLSETVVLAALEESDKALEKAEKKIVDLKRQLKNPGESDDDKAELLARIEALEEQVKEKTQAQDEFQKELQNARTKNRELIDALKAKHTTSNAGDGSNQDKPKAKQPEQKFSEADMALIRRHKLDPKKIGNIIK